MWGSSTVGFVEDGSDFEISDGDWHLYRFGLGELSDTKDQTLIITINLLDCPLADDSKFTVRTGWGTDDRSEWKVGCTSSNQFVLDSVSSGFWQIEVRRCEFEAGHFFVSISGAEGLVDEDLSAGVLARYMITAKLSEEVYEQLPKECAHVTTTSGETVYAEFPGENIQSEITFWVDVTDSNGYWDNGKTGTALQVSDQEDMFTCGGGWSDNCQAVVDEDIRSALGGGCVRYICAISVPTCDFT